MLKKILVPIADGVEDIETVTIIDVLRRANAKVIVASIKPNTLTITAARQTKIIADCLLDDCRNAAFDLIALPGGLPGAEHLRDHPLLIELLREQNQQGKLYAAICASPAIVLASHGLLSNKTATCYPGLVHHLPDQRRASDIVVVDRNCITSQGPATAMQFALTLVEQLYDKELRDQLARQLLVNN